MMLVGVVCCQRVNRCSRQLLYIYEVGMIFPLRYLSPDLSSQYVEWRRPPQPVYTLDHAAYVQILTWFFDSHSTLCPFSVHRMAPKELGKDVEPWFGPSAAVGAIRCLYHHRCRMYADVSFKSWVESLPEALLGFSVAVDGQIFQMDVYSASHPPT